MTAAVGRASVALAGALMKFLPATRSGRLLTLIYHRVRPWRDELFPGEVTAEQFDWQIVLLSRHCNPLPLDEAVARLSAGDLPPRAVSVTFDDGYQDNARIAMPILQRHRVPATFFVATSFLNGGIMWNDAVVEAIRATTSRQLDLTDIGLGSAALGSPEARGRFAERIIGRIKHLEQQERARLVDQVVQRSGVPLPRDLMMTDDEVRSLVAGGMEVGAHTRSHPILCTLDDDAARHEISGSRDDLERLIGKPVTAFAYPNGRPGEDYGPRECRMVENLGFQYAMATRWGAAGKATDRFQLPRFTPWDRDPTRWLARLLLTFRNCV